MCKMKKKKIKKNKIKIKVWVQEKDCGGVNECGSETINLDAYRSVVESVNGFNILAKKLLN